MAKLAFILASLASLATQVVGVQYWQAASHSGSGFYDGFTFETFADPTHGRVKYVDGNTARSLNLTYASGDRFFLKADSTTRLGSGGDGRKSVRLRSNKQYSTSVMIFNVWHMPQGCGTWPAIWTVGADWPNKGEIDILEGVNDVGPNQATLHTNSGCTMPASRSQTGTATGNNCDVAATNNAGCGVKINDGRSYGPSFNSNRGGWLAVERTNNFIKVWQWSRNGGNVPGDVSNGATTVNTDSWGTPAAFFPNNSCNISQKFGPHNIVINLTFCGDWAGAVYGSSGCPSSCVDFVNNNPQAFTNAYFEFQWVKVFGP